MDKTMWDFYNIIHLFGKCLCRSFQCWHISLCNVKEIIFVTIDLIRKKIKCWETINVTKVDENFPKFKFPLEAQILSLAKKYYQLFLLKWLAHSFLKKYLPDTNVSIVIGYKLFFQVKSMFHVDSGWCNLWLTPPHTCLPRPPPYFDMHFPFCHREHFLNSLF